MDEVRNEHARAFVDRLVRERFGGVRRDAAKAFGVSGSLLSEFLNGSRGAGMRFIDGVARYAGVPVDVVISGAEPLSGPRTIAPLDQHPAWPAARAAAAARFGRYVPADVLDEVGHVILPMRPTMLSVELVRRLADAVIQAREDEAAADSAAASVTDVTPKTAK